MVTSKKESFSKLSCFSRDSRKKGISAIVATVLIILITVAAVSIIWSVIIPMISNDLDSDSLGSDLTRLEIISSEGYTVWDEATKIASVQIGRGADDSFRLDGIQVVFGMPSASSVLFQLNASEVPMPNQAKVYFFNLTGRPLNVKIAPIFGGVVGKIISEISGFPVSAQSPGAGTILHHPGPDDGSGQSSGEGTTITIIECVDGQTQLCSNQDGVCSGSQETCAGGVWPGCDYSSILDYQSNGAFPWESSCGDGLDNDCDGYNDCSDCDCFEAAPMGSGGCEDCSGGNICGDGVCGLYESCSADCLTELLSYYSGYGCWDVTDNDGDGYTDTDDCDCFELTGYECSGGLA